MKRLKQFQRNLQSITQVLLHQTTAEDVVCGQYRQAYHTQPLKYGVVARLVTVVAVVKWDIHQLVEHMVKKRQKYRQEIN
tara:strand:- start:548 stop:787 length:240 start_codon:yes stop_codon:yes gene_type:complete